MKFSQFLVLVSVLVLSACAGKPMIAVMQNPKTGEIAQCKVSTADEDTARDEAEDCAKAYEKGGWVRLSQ